MNGRERMNTRAEAKEFAAPGAGEKVKGFEVEARTVLEGDASLDAVLRGEYRSCSPPTFSRTRGK